MFAIMYPEIPSETLSRISVKAGFADDLIILAFAALPRCGPFLKQEGLGPPRSMKLVFSRGDPLVARGRFEWTLENNGTQNLPRNHLSPPHPSFPSFCFEPSHRFLDQSDFGYSVSNVPSSIPPAQVQDLS